MSAPTGPEPQLCPGCGRANTTRLIVGVRLCWCCVSRLRVAAEVVQLHATESVQITPGDLGVKVGLN